MSTFKQDLNSAILQMGEEEWDQGYYLSSGLLSMILAKIQRINELTGRNLLSLTEVVFCVRSFGMELCFF